MPLIGGVQPITLAKTYKVCGFLRNPNDPFLCMFMTGGTNTCIGVYVEAGKHQVSFLSANHICFRTQSLTTLKLLEEANLTRKQWKADPV